MADLDLPYFDQILDRLGGAPASNLAHAFERHVHWGYFDAPYAGDDSVGGYVAAAERLTRRMCTAAGLRDGTAILDVGCGFGGTIEHVNAQVSDCELVGLNIDARQLDRARQLVRAQAGNQVSFVHGDACAPPFEAGRFDAALAIECAFHFSSRRRFMAEMHRVLKPGARLVLSDFILNPARLAELGAWMKSNEAPTTDFYGSNRIPPTAGRYERLAQRSGFRMVEDEDITAHTLPTYAAMRRLYREAELPDGVESTTYLEQLARHGFIEYHVLTLAR